MTRRHLLPTLAALGTAPALLTRSFGQETDAPTKATRDLPKIDRVTIHHGNLDPKDRNSWLIHVVAIEAGGETGWGEAATTYYKPSVGIPAVAEDLARRSLLGRNPLANVALWREMENVLDANYRGGAIAFGALSAIDAALWDLKGKLLGQPVPILLGGAVRETLRAYANGWCYNLTEPKQYADAARRVADDGFTAMKLDPFRHHPGGFNEHPAPGGNITRRWLDIGFERLAAIREAVGPHVDVILEAHAKFSPATGIEIGRRAAELGILFLEEPIDSYDPETMRRVADQQPTPLAAGERMVRFDDFRPYVDARAFAIAQPDIGVVGGITASKKMADYAATRGILYQSHNSALGLNTAAAVNLSATLPNFIIQEVFPYRPDDWYGQLRDPYEKRIKDGHIPVSDRPGLGVEVNTEWLRGRFKAVTVE